MQANIRIPLTYLVSAIVSYGVATAVLPAVGLWADLSRCGIVLLVSSAVIYALLTAELKRRDATESLLRERAIYDPLTGLVNRAHFQEMLDRALARAERGKQQFGVAYIDLNDFKIVNDQHGHLVGDAVLREMAARIASVVRAGDCAARIGGDEFVVLVEDRNDFGVYKLAERLREAFSPEVTIDGLTLNVSASIGVAVYPGDGRQGVALLKAADQAMYSAKSCRKGKGVEPLSTAA